MWTRQTHIFFKSSGFLLAFLYIACIHHIFPRAPRHLAILDNYGICFHDVHKGSVWVLVCLEFKSGCSVSVADAKMPRSPSCLDGLIFQHKWTTHSISTLIRHRMLLLYLQLSLFLMFDRMLAHPTQFSEAGQKVQGAFFLMLKRIWKYKTSNLSSCDVSQIPHHDWNEIHMTPISIKIKATFLLHTWIYPPIKHNPSITSFSAYLDHQSWSANQMNEGVSLPTDAS